MQMNTRRSLLWVTLQHNTKINDTIYNDINAYAAEDEFINIANSKHHKRLTFASRGSSSSSTTISDVIPHMPFAVVKGHP